MDFDRTGWSAGVAEEQVGAVLAQLQPVHDFAALHGVLLARQTPLGLATSRLAHVLVDGAGILTIGVETRPDALADALRVSDAACRVVREALAEAGIEVPPEAVSGLVVVVGADVSQLSLDAASAARVTDIDVLASLLARRAEPAAGASLALEQQAALLSALVRLDRSRDAEAVRAHALHVGAPQQAPAAPASAPPVAPVGSIAPPLDDAAPAPETPRQPTLVTSTDQRTDTPTNVVMSVLLGIAVIVVAVAVVGTGIWVVRTIAGGRTTPTGSAGTETSTPSAQPTQTPGAGATSSPEPIEEPEPAEEPQPPTLAMAKKALRKEDSRVYASLVNPDDPRIDEVGGQATFTWEYLQRTSDNATAIHTVTITLTGDGRILDLTFD